MRNAYQGYSIFGSRNSTTYMVQLNPRKIRSVVARMLHAVGPWLRSQIRKSTRMAGQRYVSIYTEQIHSTPAYYQVHVYYQVHIRLARYWMFCISCWRDNEKLQSTLLNSELWNGKVSRKLLQRGYLDADSPDEDRYTYVFYQKWPLPCWPHECN
jgi:hypothetical protein